MFLKSMFFLDCLIVWTFTDVSVSHWRHIHQKNKCCFIAQMPPLKHAHIHKLSIRFWLCKNHPQTYQLKELAYLFAVLWKGALSWAGWKDFFSSSEGHFCSYLLGWPVGWSEWPLADPMLSSILRQVRIDLFTVMPGRAQMVPEKACEALGARMGDGLHSVFSHEGRNTRLYHFLRDVLKSSKKVNREKRIIALDTRATKKHKHTSPLLITFSPFSLYHSVTSWVMDHPLAWQQYVTLTLR